MSEAAAAPGSATETAVLKDFDREAVICPPTPAAAAGSKRPAVLSPLSAAPEGWAASPYSSPTVPESSARPRKRARNDPEDTTSAGGLEIQQHQEENAEEEEEQPALGDARAEAGAGAEVEPGPSPLQPALLQPEPAAADDQDPPANHPTVRPQEAAPSHGIQPSAVPPPDAELPDVQRDKQQAVAVVAAAPQDAAAAPPEEALKAAPQEAAAPPSREAAAAPPQAAAAAAASEEAEAVAAVPQEAAAPPPQEAAEAPPHEAAAAPPQEAVEAVAKEAAAATPQEAAEGAAKEAAAAAAHDAAAAAVPQELAPAAVAAAAAQQEVAAVMPFGMFAGRPLEQVPAFYYCWLCQQEHMWRQHPDLCQKLLKGDLIQPAQPGAAAPVSGHPYLSGYRPVWRVAPATAEEEQEAAVATIAFGMHRDKLLTEVPPSYIEWTCHTPHFWHLEEYGKRVLLRHLEVLGRVGYMADEGRVVVKHEWVAPWYEQHPEELARELERLDARMSYSHWW